MLHRAGSLFDAYDLLDAERAHGRLYRGMSEAELRQAIERGYLLSDGRACARGEGTCFDENSGGALSYAAYGSTEPQKTGKAVYVVEVDSQGITRARDGYYKTNAPVALMGSERVFRLSADGDGYRLMATRIERR